MPVYFRPHPRDPVAEALLRPLRALPNVRFSDAAGPLADLLARVGVGVSIYSSTILECAASGVVPVIFNITTMPHYVPDLAAAGAAIEVRTEEDAYAALLDLLAATGGAEAFGPGLDRFQAQFFPARGTAALARIGHELERLMASRA